MSVHQDVQGIISSLPELEVDPGKIALTCRAGAYRSGWLTIMKVCSDGRPRGNFGKEGIRNLVEAHRQAIFAADEYNQKSRQLPMIVVVQLGKTLPLATHTSKDDERLRGMESEFLVDLLAYGLVMDVGVLVQSFINVGTTFTRRVLGTEYSSPIFRGLPEAIAFVDSKFS